MPEAVEFPVTREGRIIVCITPDAVAHVAPDGTLAGDEPSQELARRLQALGARLLPLFGTAQARLRAQEAATGGVGLSRFYCLTFDHDERGEEDPADYMAQLLEREDAAAEHVKALADSALVSAAYYRPPMRGASGPIEPDPLRPTIDLKPRQGYLGAAPTGIDAEFAWSVPGGRGDGVNVIDVEAAWCFTHEDLKLGCGGRLNDGVIGGLEARNHGTAVAGIVGGDATDAGIIGITPAAQFSGMGSENEPGGVATAIWAAADLLQPGDVLLVEVHAPGPIAIYNGARDSDLDAGYIAAEFYPDVFAAIRWATDRGIVVVAAAGNGGIDLTHTDRARQRGGGRSSPWWSTYDWPDPFTRSEGGDSGSILVGAGEPPDGALPERSRATFSNFGECVDVQAWGRRVVTTGGAGAGEGDLQAGVEEARWYTGSFSGTSSAAAIVAGVVASIQGTLIAAGKRPMTPAQLRALLRSTGSEQVAGAGGVRDPRAERIGPLPDLRRLIPGAFDVAPWAEPGGQERATAMPSGVMPCVTVLVGCGGPSGAFAAGPHWGGPHWGGPHWGGPHWGGPHWGGPHWGGPAAVEPAPALAAASSALLRPGFAR